MLKPSERITHFFIVISVINWIVVIVHNRAYSLVEQWLYATIGAFVFSVIGATMILLFAVFYRYTRKLFKDETEVLFSHNDRKK